MQAVRADGKAFAVEVSLSHLGEGADRLSTMMLRDATERDRAEAETRARIEAEAASHAKMLMLSYIAHEIGNPLSGILGFAHLMASDIADPLPPGQARRLEQIEASGRHLQTLMRDVLDVSRFEIGSFEIDRRPVDVAACAERALAAVAAQAEQAGIDLKLLQPAAGRIVGDADRLHQCLVNLLLNAIKYNGRGGHVEMAVRAEGSAATIDVRDDGLGLDEAQRAALFEPFNRLGRGASNATGTGIGLLLTRRLVDAMDGRISVDSQPGRGSCFRLTFALA